MSNSFVPSEPYNALPILPPQVEIETKAVLKRTISARTAVEGLRYAAKTMPNQALLLKAIALQEARASSEIESIVTTHDDIYRALSHNEVSDDPHTKEVLRYAQATWQGFESIKKGKLLNLDAIHHIASIINQKEAGVRLNPGTRIGNPRTGKTVYTPPVGQERIEGLLRNLVEYIHLKDEIDPLIKIAVAHYQFEAIHPYVDGNGRTGRVLNVLWMVEKGLLDVPILYLSHAIIESRSEYYRALRQVTERGDWQGWVLYLLEIMELTAIETRRRIAAITNALSESRDIVRREAPKIYSSELVDIIFSQPFTRIAHLEQAGIAKRQTASVYLRELERIGVLRSETKWREVLFINDRLLQALM